MLEVGVQRVTLAAMHARLSAPRPTPTEMLIVGTAGGYTCASSQHNCGVKSQTQVYACLTTSSVQLKHFTPFPNGLVRVTKLSARMQHWPEFEYAAMRGTINGQSNSIYRLSHPATLSEFSCLPRHLPYFLSWPSASLLIFESYLSPNPALSVCVSTQSATIST